jgi:hypothetical protein
VISPGPFSAVRRDAPDEPEPTSDRQTVLPDFDPEAFARDSEVQLRPARLPKGGETTTEEARRLLEEGEPERALFLLARLLEQAPLHVEGNALSKECAAAFEQECLSVIGSPATVLVVALSPDELKGFGLDHVSGFFLSLMDGHTNVETLLDLCGLSRLPGLRHLRDLVQRGIVQVRRRGT